MKLNLTLEEQKTSLNLGMKEIQKGIGGTGDGDMKKSVYDTNNNGIVDNAEMVNGHTVQENVPSGAKFTDTVYDDTDLRNQISSIHEPTMVSELVNDTGYITSSALTYYYTKTEEDTILENYYTKAEEDIKLSDKANCTDIPTKTSELTNDCGFVDTACLIDYAKKTDLTNYVDLTSNQTINGKKTFMNNTIFTMQGYVDRDYTVMSYDGLSIRVGNYGSIFLKRFYDTLCNMQMVLIGIKSQWFDGVVRFVSSKRPQVVNTTNATTQYEEMAYLSDIPDTSTFALKTELPTKTSELINDTGFIDSTGLSAYALKSELFSGSYNDLTDKPTLFSGNYNDLTNKPTIPTVPTVLSAFTNDTGFITSSALSTYALKSEIPTVPTALSSFTNDTNFITKSVADLTNYYDKTYIDTKLGDIETLLGAI